RSGLCSLMAVGLLLALWAGAAAQKDKPKFLSNDKVKDKDKAKEKSKVKPRIIDEPKCKDKKDKKDRDKKDKSRDIDSPKRYKWEYCSLSLKSDSGAKTKKYVWTIGNTIFETTSLKELGEKLKMKFTPNTKTAILNHLGEEGWELVNYGGAFAKADISYDMYY